MPSKLSKRPAKTRHDDLTPWEKLTDEEQKTFLSAYQNIDARSVRSKHSFLHEDGMKTLFAYYISLWERISTADEKITELKVTLGEGPPPSAEPDLFHALRCALGEVPQRKHRGAVACEVVLTCGFLFFIKARNWEMLEWLTDFVKDHQHGPFPAPYDSRKEKFDCSPFLHGFILREFVRLTGSSIASLHSPLHPRPSHLPTKKFLREEVGKLWMGASLTKGGKKGFYNALSELGLGGLPEAKSGPPETTRQEAAKAKQRICGS